MTPLRPQTRCRCCESVLTHVVIDIGKTPLANSLQDEAQLVGPESYFPLRALFCVECGLLQTEDFNRPEEIFSDYAYFSSFSSTWINHCRHHATTMIECLGLGPASFVVEVASNDGCLLRNFVTAKIPALGVEPAENVAETARAAGVPTISAFFGAGTAREIAARHGPADLMLANNVLAHVPDLNDFVLGFKLLLKPDGMATLEFPHLLNLVRECQFDTLYHEHFSYFSLATAVHVFARHGLEVFDVEEVPTHGGSLRIHVQHQGARPRTKAVDELLSRERAEGLTDLSAYAGFSERAFNIKLDLLDFLISAKRKEKKVVAYGAAAKGNTLINYCGIRYDLIALVADANPTKQGKYLPGSGIPVVTPQALLEAKPDYVLILPWNIRDEVCREMAPIREWGGRFVTAIPTLEVW